VLKGMFAWCHDTRQCQDVLFSNQRCQNEKLGIDEFPLPMPPLDVDPFATLAVADIMTMEANDDDVEGGSCSEYDDEEEEGDDDKEDYDE
jgi:hypothetical protein